MTGTIHRGDGSATTLTRLIIAWAITIPLAISPNVVGSGTPSPARWALFVALLSLAGLPFVWTAARSLRTYAGMLALLTLLAVFLENALPAWASGQPWFPDPSGYPAAFILQSPKVVAAFVMMTVLTLLGYRRREFFLPSVLPRKVWIGLGVGTPVVMGLTLLLYMKSASLAGSESAAVP